MIVLALNAGSSSLKFALFEGEKVLNRGVIERIGQPGGPADMQEAVQRMAKRVEAVCGWERVGAVGHRVVHGGTRYSKPARVTPELKEAVAELAVLAPLHNPLNLAVIERAEALAPKVPHVAVFDTAFHQTLAPSAYLYGLPREVYEKHGVRRYGFHGISHAYAVRTAADWLNRPVRSLRLITLHLGSGASLCAVKNGQSVDTSMGFTPTAGLVMGTRCGDVDPAAVCRLEALGYDPQALMEKEGGLKGLCGDSDMRTVLRRAEAGEETAREALAVYVQQIRRYLGAYWLELGGADALVFTGGVGERAEKIRQMVCEGLGPFGVVLDEAKNACHARDISAKEAKVRVLVVPADEERAIARETRTLLEI